MRPPVVLHFDRQALAVDIQNLNKRKELLKKELAEVESQLEVKQNKLNQISLIAINRLRKHDAK